MLKYALSGAGDPGAYAFSRALRENTTLVDLNISHNNVSSPMMASLQVSSMNLLVSAGTPHVEGNLVRHGQDDILKNRKISACWTAAGMLGQSVPNALAAPTLIQGGAGNRTAADRSQEEEKANENIVSTAAARRAGNARFQEAYVRSLPCCDSIACFRIRTCHL